MENQEQFTFFWETRSPLSQWHPSDFTVDGVAFNCAEQYMMCQKAKLFEDQQIAAQILLTKKPRDQKALGRKVRNFDSAIWNNHCKKIVYEGNYAKFTQNEALKASLLATTGTTLVEASPYDKIWGIGLAADHPDAQDKSKWQGTNWLGEVLTQLRNDLINEA
ncbi:NADAR family protein [uncultured Microscilla sp.]|uniref:NADAR family protein n=1 Tax=uncultured Microscilla sp. TaxID=432653 RepID=UPI0026227849|nr:NADAR family protein [uncultured Microscilla sp.]